MTTSSDIIVNSHGYLRSGGSSSYNYGYSLSLGDSTNSMGMFSGPGGEEGGIVVSPDTCIIYNSFDQGYGFAVFDKDRGGDLTTANSRVFSIDQSNYFAWSRGGFAKEGSSNDYVLLGGGSHKAVSDFITTSNISSQSVNYATSAGTLSGMTRNSSSNWSSTGLSMIMGMSDSWGGDCLFLTNQSGQMSFEVDGCFYQRRDSGGSFRCLDTGDLSGLNSSFFKYEGYWNGTYNVDNAKGMKFVYSGDGAPFSWGVLATFEPTESAGYKLQIGSNGYWNGGLYYRNRSSDRGGWTNWCQIIDSDIIGSQSVNYASSAGSVSWSNVTSKPSVISEQYDSTLHIRFTGGGNWNEGIRLHTNNEWNSIVMCGSDNTGDTGTSARTWSIHNYYGTLYITKNGSSSGTNYMYANDNTWVFSSAVYSNSDRHIKSHIKIIDRLSLERLFKVSDKLLKKYTLKQTGKESYGFVAQELEKYIPEAVSEHPANKIKSVSYNVAYAKVIASLIHKIKSLESKVEDLSKLVEK